MKRRIFFRSVLGPIILLPINGTAQTPPKHFRLGFLGAGSKSANTYYSAFPTAMRAMGYVESRDFLLAERYADGNLSPLSSLAEEIVQLKPDVIVASSTPAVIALRKTTRDIAIVCPVLTNPINLGFAASEARPGGNVTGIFSRLEGLPGKQVEIARDLIPTLDKIGVLTRADSLSNDIQEREIKTAAAQLGLRYVSVSIRGPDEIGAAMQKFVQERAGFAIILGDPLLLSLRRLIAAFALAVRLPTVFNYREHVEGGGLISYGVNLRANYRRAAYYVDRILKGDKAADLPIEFPTKVELILNQATAKALGLIVSPSILVRADEVLE